MSVFTPIDPAIQKFVLRFSDWWHRRRRPGTRTAWVVGPAEIAGLTRAISEALDSSESALLTSHPFYDYDYDWVAPKARTRLGRLVQGPWKLGELLARVEGFVYISAVGYLDRLDDARDFEFSYLRSRGKKIVCYFAGNDIRAPRLSAQREQVTGQPNMATYLAETNPVFASAAYEELQRAVAASAEAHADLIFSADVDQVSYLRRPSEPFLYFHPDDEIADDFAKFHDVRKPVILHAPSSPIIKGTQIVRAAIAELHEDGYEFDYVELVRQPHAEVRASLRRAHIVLNQFYAEVPGVFGVEALAAGCVVMMSADDRVEPCLPSGSHEAWVVTRHHQVAKHLRELLDDRGSWEPQARAGVDWVRHHAALSVTGAALRAKLAPLVSNGRAMSTSAEA